MSHYNPSVHPQVLQAHKVAEATVPESTTRVQKPPVDDSWLARTGASLSLILTLLLLYVGWQQRQNSPLTAESGLGYALGIVGSVLMLLLLLYPLRKRVRIMRHLGSVRSWFRVHMIFGVLGPVLVLFHTNFQLGALNSNVALFCMLLVSSSGLIGRYFYRKIHNGLYGRKATLQDLSQESALVKGKLTAALTLEPSLHARIQALEQSALSPARDMLNITRRSLETGLYTYWLQITLGRALKQALFIEAHNKGLTKEEWRLKVRHEKTHLATYLATVRKINQLAFYERLFSWWHIFHLPLFAMMLISSIVHVVAVHLY